MLYKCLFPTTDGLIRCTSAALVIILTACESDTDKMGRLRGDYLTADLNYQHWSARCDSVLRSELGNKRPTAHSGPNTLVCADTLYQWMVKRDLAERDLNKFMHR